MPTSRPSRLPPWLKVPYRGAAARDEVRQLLRELELHTVCESARCPNLCQCWARRTATFLILGNACTRNCRFCAVGHGTPGPVAADEPARVAKAAMALGLRFAVITSVTRDDLPDGGASHFAATITAVRAAVSEVRIEVLTPDFAGRVADIATVLAAAPDVFNHNLETCARLTPAIRSGGDYRRSLEVLRLAREQAGDRGLIKSGFMLGLGETDAEIQQMLGDLKACGVCILTIGQYLAPSSMHWPVARYVTPDEFTEWGNVARTEFGFAYVVSQPLVRSSYLAEDGYAKLAGETAGEMPRPQPVHPEQDAQATISS